jgi:hypothetical protein
MCDPICLKARAIATSAEATKIALSGDDHEAHYSGTCCPVAASGDRRAGSRLRPQRGSPNLLDTARSLASGVSSRLSELRSAAGRSYPRGPQLFVCGAPAAHTSQWMARGEAERRLSCPAMSCQNLPVATGGVILHFPRSYTRRSPGSSPPRGDWHAHYRRV